MCRNASTLTTFHLTSLSLMISHSSQRGISYGMYLFGYFLVHSLYVAQLEARGMNKQRRPLQKKPKRPGLCGLDYSPRTKLPRLILLSLIETLFCIVIFFDKLLFFSALIYPIPPLFELAGISLILSIILFFFSSLFFFFYCWFLVSFLCGFAVLAMSFILLCNVT